MDPGVLDSQILGLQTLEHVLRVSRTWDSILSLMPKGGETIWGNLDWSPEEGFPCDLSKKRNLQSYTTDQNFNISDVNRGFLMEKTVKYGRIISFGKAASELPGSQLTTLDSKVPYSIISLLVLSLNKIYQTNL